MSDLKPAVCEDCRNAKPKSKITRDKNGTTYTLWLCRPCAEERQQLFLRNATLSRTGEVAPGVTLPPPPPMTNTASPPSLDSSTPNKTDPTYQALPVLSEPAKPRRAAPDAAAVAAAPNVVVAPPPAVVLPPAPVALVALPPQPQPAAVQPPQPPQQTRPDVHYESLPRKASLPPPAAATTTSDDDLQHANNGGSNSNSGRSPKEEESFQSIQPASTASLTYVELPGEDEIKAARVADRPPAALPPGVAPPAGGALPPMPMAPTTSAFKAPMLVRRSVVDDSAASAAAAAAADEMSEALKSPKSNANAMLLRSSSSATNLVHNNNAAAAATANNAHGRASTAAPPVSALARKSSTNEPFEVRLQRLITSESFWAPNVTSRGMARTQLTSLGVGSFLVRPSSSEIANSFALSHHDRAHGVGHLLLCCHEEPNGSISYSICPDRNKEPTSPTVLGMLQNLGFPDNCRCGWELEGPAPAASAAPSAAASGSGASHAMMLQHAVSSPMLMHQQRTSSAHISASNVLSASVGGAQARTSLAQLAASIPSVPIASPKPHDNDSGGSIDAGLEDLHPGAGVEWQPDADRPQAEEWLRTREPGSYLVRPSKGRPGCLTVSCKEKPSGKIVHASIFRGADGKWHTEAKQTLRWATVRELLRALPYNLIVEDIYVPLASVSDQGIVISPRTSTVSQPAAASATMAIPAQPAAALSPAMSRPGPGGGNNQFRMPNDPAALRGGLNRMTAKPPSALAVSPPVVQRGPSNGVEKSTNSRASAVASADTADDLESLFPTLPTDASVEALFPTVAIASPPVTTASRQSATRPLDKSPPKTTPAPVAALSQSGRTPPRRESLGLPSSASSDKPPARSVPGGAAAAASAAAANKPAAKPEPAPEKDSYGSAKLIGMRAKAGAVVSASAVEARQIANGTKDGPYRSMPSMGNGSDLDAEFDAIQIENVEY